MDNSFKNLIKDAKSILILLPSDPKFDEVAAGASLYLALREEQGKEINIYSPSSMIVEFNSIVAVNKIKSEIGNKNLAISFKDYNPQGIEKVSWDINEGEFKLTVVPKVNVLPPNEDQVIVSYMGVAADVVIMVGGKDENSFQVIKTDDLKDAKLIHIGTSQLNITGKNISSLATPGSSVSEVTANLIKNANYQISNDIATNLVMGIEENTKGFGSAATADTFLLIGELMRLGGKRMSQQTAPTTVPMGVSGMPGPVPASWTEPKIFKGTNLS